MKPDFDMMSKAELRAYLLDHRNDNEAFYRFVDRLKADNQDAVRYPCPKTLKDWAKTQQIIQDHLRKLEES